MTTLEVVLTVAAPAVVALLLFGLAVHGRTMEQRSALERSLLAVLALALTAIITALIIYARRNSIANTARSAQTDQGDQTSRQTIRSSEAPPASASQTSTLEAPMPETPTRKTKPTDDTRVTPDLSRLRSRSDESTAIEAPESRSEEPQSGDTATRTKEKVQIDRRQPSTCSEANTGHYGFTNTKKETLFTVILYYREGSDAGRTITVPPGQTQYVYDFPVGGHNYIVTYRAQVPIMTFPPGAPTMPQDVIYLRGEVYVEQCKSPIMEIQ